MDKISFFKYQGTGNDFVMIDNRLLQFPKDKFLIQKICDRRFGIGGDGLILLEEDNSVDFKMVYYNSDGNESTMCGNGGRCLVSFAQYLGIFKDNCTFNAIDGLHEAKIENDLVKLKMIDVNSIESTASNFVLNTGSPHFVKYVSNVENYDVYSEGKSIRNSSDFSKEGINVNFVEEISENELFVRTYERGVENETLSCGTGVTASALTYFLKNNTNKICVTTLGGTLSVYASKTNSGFDNIWLEGPAIQVFSGEILL